MNKSFALAFGGALAFILLMLYAVSVIYMIIAVAAWDRTVPVKPVEFSSGLVLVVTTVGGLVSALVITKLAVTPPGQSPTISLPAADEDEGPSRTEVWLALLYLIIWLIVGLGALIVGVMLHPDANQTLHDLGATWLGLAITSSYAYFGITPKT
jgi:hypothetical protein